MTEEIIVLAEGQAQALAQLMAGMDEGGRWVLMLGPEGSGKSTVLRRLLAELELTEADTVVCDGSGAPGADGLMAVLRSQLELSPRPAPRSLWGSLPLEDLLAKQRLRGRPLVIVVDDAHVLPRSSLALLAELATRPTGTDPAVFVVLAGGPALEQAALRAWGEAGGGRGPVTCRVMPFTADEARQYVDRRMQAGAGASLALSEPVTHRILQYTNGIPGLINALCDRVIAHPASRLADHVSADTVDEAAQHLGLRPSPPAWLWGPLGTEPVGTRGEQPTGDRPASGRRWRRAGLLTGVTLVAGLLVYLGPALLKASLHWLAGSPEVAQLAPGPAGLGPPHAESPRREAASRASSSGRGVPGAVAANRHTGEQRPAALDRADKTAMARGAAPAPRPVAAPPSAEQVAALLAGAREGRVADLNRLLAGGVPANVRDANGFTPLMLAVVSGHLPAARALLDRGAHVNARNRGGITPIMLAVIGEHPELLTLLLERGADVNAPSGSGWTALTFAAWKGDENLVRMLLAHGANPTAPDKQQWTPLDYAAWKARSHSPSSEGTAAGAVAPAGPTNISEGAAVGHPQDAAPARP